MFISPPAVIGGIALARLARAARVAFAILCALGLAYLIALLDWLEGQLPTGGVQAPIPGV